MEVESNRIDSSPLQVYVRIRPFIGDEIAQGENQNLIDIVDEHRIAVKYSSNIPNTLRHGQTSYNEYKVTQLFDQNASQTQLFDQILRQPIDELFSGINRLFCTLGLTNSGKTQTMFGTKNESGLIPQCLQRIFDHIGEQIDHQLLFKPDGLENLMPTTHLSFDTEIAVRNYVFTDASRRNRLPDLIRQYDAMPEISLEEEHHSVWISFFELYNETILDLLVAPKRMKTRKHLRLIQNEHSTVIKNLIQIPVFDLSEAEAIIRFGLINRSTSKTHLNEASSRSHAVLCITLITNNEFDEEPRMSHMYICDLAGNEPSMNTGKQLAETCHINTSLMTFKDCIRVLNENQTAKKQHLVPYRNSVLTSIFRPFFVGRGRTIICCNVNPCATFVNQTNELLKFCALAHKTIIVAAVVRAQRKSKNKAPKRLGRDAVLREKNGKNTTNQEEKEDDIPTDTASITYWKYCTQKALQSLQQQASHRRTLLIERHRERLQAVQYLLHQRQQIEILAKEKDSISTQYDHLREDHRRLQQMYNESIQNEKRMQNLQDEVQRLKRELSLELYRKQDAEKKARLYEEKLRSEQSEFQKMQYDFAKAKLDLKTVQVKYDALQMEMTELNEPTKPNTTSIIAMFDDRTSTTTTATATIYEEPSSHLSIETGPTRVKRRTDDQQEKETKKLKVILRQESGASIYKTIPLTIKRPKKKPTNSAQEGPTNVKGSAASHRSKQPVIDSPVKVVQKESQSPIYATIQRHRSPDRTSFATTNVTPKTSTFKRIQSFFKATPTLGGSARVNRVTQVKKSTVAFGSSTPTNRAPPPPPPPPSSTASGSHVKKIPSPKTRYNLRTRIFNNPSANSKDDDEKKSQCRWPLRTRK